MTWKIMRRDIYVHPIIIIGCIGPAFLCVFIIVLLYFQWFQPQLTWFYGGEMEAALNRYEHIRAAVFRGERPPSDLAMVATGMQLNELLERLNSESNKLDYVSNSTTAQLIENIYIYEYTGNCSLATVEGYYKYGYFVLTQEDDTWKVYTSGPNSPGSGFEIPIGICRHFKDNS